MQNHEFFVHIHLLVHFNHKRLIFEASVGRYGVAIWGIKLHAIAIVLEDFSNVVHQTLVARPIVVKSYADIGIGFDAWE